MTSILMRMPFFPGLMEMRNRRRAKLQFQNWLKSQQAIGSRIVLPLHFLGLPAGYNYVKILSNLWIEPDVSIWISEDKDTRPLLTLGKDVYIGRHTYLGVHSPIEIGQNTIIGAYSYIISANHRYESREIPIKNQGFQGTPIKIGEDVWIGTHVVILPGAKIGRGAIIGAGSIVNSEIPEYEIWGGVPARFIKSRP